MTETTRAKSVNKPADHQPKKETKVAIKFAGESYEFDVRAAKHTPTMFALRKDDMETVLINVVGEDGLERAIKSLEDEDGYSDFEKLAELVKEIYEAAGQKN
ncbi:MAG: hypothetical protein ACTILN_15405 [Marinobacter sp.]